MEILTWEDMKRGIAEVCRENMQLRFENARLRDEIKGRRSNSIMDAALEAACVDSDEVTLRKQVIYLGGELNRAECEAAELREKLRDATTPCGAECSRMSPCQPIRTDCLQVGSENPTVKTVATLHPNPEPRIPNPEVQHAGA